MVKNLAVHTKCSIPVSIECRSIHFSFESIDNIFCLIEQLPIYLWTVEILSLLHMSGLVVMLGNLE